MPKQNLTHTLAHPNAFVRFYIPNVEGLSGPNLPPLDEYFIHVWARSTPAFDVFDTHDHIFTFQSEILHGSMTQEVYDPVPDENGNWIKVDCRPGGQIHRKSPNFYRLDLLETAHYKRGDIHVLGEDEVHRITDYEDGTVTKVVRHTQRKCRGDYYLTRKNWEQYPLTVMATFGVSADA